MLDFGVHGHILATHFGNFFTGYKVVTLDGALRHLFVALAPVAQGVTKPRRFGFELGQAQLFPNGFGVFHELFFGQGNGREVVFECGINEQGRVHAMVARTARAVAGVAVLQHLQIKGKVGSVAHGPQQGVGVVGIDVFIDCNHHLAARA